MILRKTLNETLGTTRYHINQNNDGWRRISEARFQKFLVEYKTTASDNEIRGHLHHENMRIER